MYAWQNRAIHRAFADLCLPYSENKAYWLNLFEDICGRTVSGLTDMTLLERRALLSHLKKQNAEVSNRFVPKALLNWKTGNPDKTASYSHPLSKEDFPGRPAESWFRDLDKGPMLKKIEAFLAEAKRPWSYVHRMAKQMGKVERIEWCTGIDLHNIIAALIIDAKRHGRRFK